LQALADCPVGSVESVTGEWGVLHVRTGVESAVARRIVPFAAAVFNPTVKVRKVNAHGRSEVDAPIFPSYLFAAWGDVYARGEVRRTRDVIDILRVTRQTELVTQLAGIERALGDDPYLDARDWIQEGRRVRVKAGPLLGTEGYIVKRRKRDVLVIAVEMLKRGVEVDIDPALVEPL
jgi:transcription antitermination factor NusG